jgi:hypothetical protein
MAGAAHTANDHTHARTHAHIRTHLRHCACDAVAVDQRAGAPAGGRVESHVQEVLRRGGPRDGAQREQLRAIVRVVAGG